MVARSWSTVSPYRDATAISEWLRRESDGGRKQVRQIVFEGERLDVLSVGAGTDLPRMHNFLAGREPHPSKLDVERKP